MTNQEAIEILRNEEYDCWCSNSGLEARRLAIESLEKDSAQDLIGEICYKPRMVAKNLFYGKFPKERKKYYIHSVNSLADFNKFKKFDNVDHWEIVEGKVTKTNCEQVGKAIFLTKLEAEAFLIQNGIDLELNVEIKQ